ncbi:hypothetical protein AA15973_1513 [Komagataeibacter sucrofermentans DSM 15973]|nr:hypothetical protein AA15973_1513 [Komagataeibacter sucrofermentans DSM 15973]
MLPHRRAVECDTRIIQPDGAMAHGWATAQATSPHNTPQGSAMHTSRCHPARAIHVSGRGVAAPGAAGWGIVVLLSCGAWRAADGDGNGMGTPKVL